MVQYTEDEIRAAVEEAASRRTYAFAHAYIPEAIQQAVRAGVRSIEHGNLLDRATADLMAAEGTFLVPTLVVYDQIARFGRELNFPDESMRKLDDVLEQGVEALDLAVSAGVSIGYGTDLLGETHDAQSREFTLRSQVQAPVDIIRSATVVNAELIGRAGELGVVAPGALADLLLLDGDPLTDIAVLAEPAGHLAFIARAGEIIRNDIAR
jgi:imidazolonepropionase-like amidohydrolase